MMYGNAQVQLLQDIVLFIHYEIKGSLSVTWGQECCEI